MLHQVWPSPSQHLYKSILWAHDVYMSVPCPHSVQVCTMSVPCLYHVQVCTMSVLCPYHTCTVYKSVQSVHCLYHPLLHCTKVVTRALDGNTNVFRTNNIYITTHKGHPSLVSPPSPVPSLPLDPSLPPSPLHWISHHQIHCCHLCHQSVPQSQPWCWQKISIIK